MHFAADNLFLLLGIVGFLALLLGCLVVAGYLVCTGLPRRPLTKHRRADIAARIDLFPW